MNKYQKGIVLRLFLFVVWVMFSVWTINQFSIGSEQEKKYNRKVVMLDAWSYFSGKNSREKYDGFFRDTETGVTFTYPVSGYIHHLYNKDKKSMEMEFPLSLKDVGLVYDKFDRMSAGILGVAASLVWIFGYLICAAIDWKGKRGFAYLAYREWRSEK